MNSIIGLWIFTSMLYNDVEMPAPNPDLVMSFEFNEDGTDTLKYYRKNEQGFCERRAFYSFDQETLYQKVYWTHPQNAYWCDNDIDMHVGTEGQNKARISKEGHLLLDLNLGDESVTLVWKKPTPPTAD